MFITKSKFAADYAIVGTTGTFKLKVSFVSQPIASKDSEGNEVIDDNGNIVMKRIINLKAVRADHVSEVKELFNGVDEIDISELNGLTMSVNARENDELPINGQEITVVVEERPSKRAGKDVLSCVGFRVPAAEKGLSFDFDEIEDTTQNEQIEE